MFKGQLEFKMMVLSTRNYSLWENVTLNEGSISTQ